MTLDREAYKKWWLSLGCTDEERGKKYRELCQKNTEKNSPIGIYAQSLLNGVEYIEPTIGINHGDYALHNYRPMSQWKLK